MPLSWEAPTTDISSPLQRRLLSLAVVAGVIGKSKSSYDVWGDAVNVAARLQGICEPGRIVVSENLKRHLGEEFRCVERGRQELKNHTPVETFYLSS